MKRKTNVFRQLYSVLDIVIVIFSYYFSEWLWMEKLADRDNFLLNDNMRIYVLYAVLAYSAVILLIDRFSDIYDSFRYKSIVRIWMKNVFANAVLVGIIMMLLYVFRIQDVSRGTLLCFFIVVCLLTLIKHCVAIGMLRLFRIDGRNQKHIIIIGDGDLAAEYVSAVTENRKYGITIDGYISNRQDKPDASLGRCLGGYDRLESLLQGTGVDEVIIALDDPKAKEVFTMIDCCEKCGTRVSVIPYYNKLISSVPSIDYVGGLKCFELRTSPLDDKLNRYTKRLFDIFFSALVLLLLSPVFLIVALGVKLSSPGPVFFKQERVGINKRNFTMYKFRSMRVNDRSDTAWSADSDPRRTAFGSFIRKTSIDELPQFINVLRGDMSVIGPRPEIPHFVEQFRETIPKYMLKHLVRPGITGWAQVCGYRGDTSIEERIKCDIWYIENWSFWLDIRIMFRTVFGGMINNEKNK